ncbi:hypothetical protein MASR1M107_12820 [Ignavibacteriales bacterium]
MPGKALIILLAGIISIAGITYLNIFDAGRKMNESTTDSFSNVQVKNIAEAGAQMAVRQMIKDTAWRTGYQNLKLFGGTINVRLKDTLFDTLNVVKVVSTAKIGAGSSAEKSWIATCYFNRFRRLTMFPPTIRGAATTNSTITTLGDMNVDGRDHNVSGGLLSGTGSLGIWTTGGLFQSGSSTIGGTNSGGTDIAPSKPADGSIVSYNQVYPGGYPSSPDSLLGGPANGYPEGTLKSIALAGLGGSQYVTNPVNLTYPLRGVTYVELPSGTKWQSANIDGTGILVIHNSAVNATITNINSGVFAGIFMSDEVVRIHTNIIGALIAISHNPQSGDCIGNGTGSILFSREAIMNAMNLINLTNSINALSANQQILYWFE